MAWAASVSDSFWRCARGLVASVCASALAFAAMSCAGKAESASETSTGSTGTASGTTASDASATSTGGASSTTAEETSTASTGGTSATSASSTGAGNGGGGNGGTRGGNVGLPSAVEDFEDDALSLTVGRWMGTGIEGALPLSESEGPVSGSSLALHIAGTAGEEGVDVMWHTAFPVEMAFHAVTFWARTGLAESNALLVTVGGPYPMYWEHLADGYEWPAAQLEITSDWQQFRVDFDALGFGPDGEPSPYSDPFGAVHFILEQNADYDFWLDDVTFVARSVD